MAEIIQTSIEPRDVTKKYPFIRIVLMALITGVVYYCLSLFVLPKLLLSTIGGEDVNVISPVAAGNVSLVFLLVIDTTLMLWMKVSRPLLVSICVGIVMWGFLDFLRPLEFNEKIIWLEVMFSLSFLVFSWISRNIRTTIALVLSALLIVAEKIMLRL